MRFSPRDPLRSWVLRPLCWGETEHFNSHSAVIEDHRDDPFHRKGASKRLLFDGAVIIFLTTDTFLFWAPQLTQPNFASLAEKSGRMQIVSLPTTLASRPFLPRCTLTHSPRRTLLRSFPSLLACSSTTGVHHLQPLLRVCPLRPPRGKHPFRRGRRSTCRAHLA